MATLGVVTDPLPPPAAAPVAAPQTYLGYKTPKNVLTYVLKAGMAKGELSIWRTVLLVSLVNEFRFLQSLLCHSRIISHASLPLCWSR